MKINEDQWRSMKINEGSIKINGNQWRINENQWRSMKINKGSMKDQWRINEGSMKINEDQ